MQPEPQERYPFWGYTELAFFVGSLVPTFLLSIGLLGLFRTLIPAGRAVENIFFQVLLYVLIVATLYMIVAVRFETSFVAAFRLGGGFGYLFLGPFIGLAVGALARQLGAPPVTSPVDLLLAGRGSLAVAGCLVVIVGPTVEELVFRGFLQPLFSKTLGSAAGILICAMLFGLMHGPQSRWAWQIVLSIALAGAAFGYLRQRTGSTTASIAAHIGFNAASFAAYLARH